MSVKFENYQASLKGALEMPGDKSISHRAIMIGSLAKGRTLIHNFLDGEDCQRTIQVFKELGVKIDQKGCRVEIKSKGYEHFISPKNPLYFGNSGTTARLMIGILSGLNLTAICHGDAYLTERPMKRVVNPLRKMNAQIIGREEGNYLPIAIDGQRLNALTYEIPVESAQVKSALIFASLFAKDQSVLTERNYTRDHTENMLRAFGADVETEGLKVTVRPQPNLVGKKVNVPGDISSAAFFIVGALLAPQSSVTLKNIGLNKTRDGILRVVKAMGADLTYDSVREENGEKVGNLTVKHSELKGLEIKGDLIPLLIDEIPIIALLATQAKGKTMIREAKELRVKETDRIKATVEMLTSFGAQVEELEDGMIINGEQKLHGAKVKSYFDHRMAMTAIIASLVTKGAVEIDDISPIAISYPEFLEDFQKLL